jgi:hypothetical protein
MSDDETPRQLPERTARHRCVRCLREIDAAMYFENDFVCDACDEESERYPLRSTPKGETARPDEKP